MAYGKKLKEIKAQKELESQIDQHIVESRN
jgi:hypothetical protein